MPTSVILIHLSSHPTFAFCESVVVLPRAATSTFSRCEVYLKPDSDTVRLELPGIRDEDGADHRTNTESNAGVPGINVSHRERQFYQLKGTNQT